MSLLGLAVDRHMRGTPGAPRRRRRDEHVQEANRASSDDHRRRGRRLRVPIARCHPLCRGGFAGPRRGEQGGGAVGAPVLAPGAFEGGPHLVERADALVPGVRRSDVQIQGERVHGRQRKREVEAVATAGRWMGFALLEVRPSRLQSIGNIGSVSGST